MKLLLKTLNYITPEYLVLIYEELDNILFLYFSARNEIISL